MVSLIGSATPSSPADLPSTATNITVWPSARSSSACAHELAGIDFQIVNQRAIAERDAMPSTSPAHAFAGDRLEIRHVDELDAAILRARNDRRAPADARCSLQTRGQSSSVSFVDRRQRSTTAIELRFAFGQRAGLIDDERVDLLA